MPPLTPSTSPAASVSRGAAPAPSHLVFRAAVEEDLDRLVDIHTSAFPDPRGAESRRRNFALSPFGPLEALRVAVLGDVIVAHAFLFAFETWFGGVPVAAGGIASVGVAPEARGLRVGAALLADLHAQSHARGDAITLLHPFRQGFYARHGYAAVTPVRRLMLHPGAIPAAWSKRGELVLRAAGGSDREAITRAFLRAAARATGWITRSEKIWTRLFADERRVWVAALEGGALAGYVAWSLAQSESHAATRLVVHELVADHDAARRALLGVVAAQRDQVAQVEIEVDANDPLDRALLDADRAQHGTAKVEHAIGIIAGGPMVRIADPRRAIEARGYAEAGAVDLDVEGEGPLRVTVSDGRASVSSAPQAALALDRTTLAAILYGALVPRDAARLGLLEVRDRAALRDADALFALAPYHAIDSF